MQARGLMSLKVRDVRGDGNCYYRCIWNIIKNNNPLRKSLFIQSTTTTEQEGVRELREYVSICVESCTKAKDALTNLLEIHRSCPDIIDCYPILNHINDSTSFEDICTRVADTIKATSVMASSFEHDIINSCMADKDMRLIVLSQATCDSQEDTMDKWTRQLHVMLPIIQESQVAIIVNIDNIHYKYGVFKGDVVINRASFKEYIDWVNDIDTNSEDEN